MKTISDLNAQYPGLVTEEGISRTTVTNFQNKLDRWVKKLDNLRSFHKIDVKMAEERDQMDEDFSED